MQVDGIVIIHSFTSTGMRDNFFEFPRSTYDTIYASQCPRRYKLINIRHLTLDFACYATVIPNAFDQLKFDGLVTMNVLIQR